MLILHHSPFEYIPGLDNDEFYYWHQILTFGQFGFDGGYYVVDETPSKAGFSHFGPHGPAFPMLYGTLSKIVGWHLFSPIFLNIIIFLVALVISLLLAKPTKSQFLWLGIFVISFWPIHLFMPVSMQQTLHQSIALLIAGSITYLLKDLRYREAVLILGCICILIGAMLRFTWALSLLTVLLAYMKPRKIISVGGVLIVTFLFLCAALLLNLYWASPYPDYTIIESLLSFDLLPIFQNFWININKFVSVNPPRLGDRSLALLSFVFRFQYVLCIIYCIFSLYFRASSIEKIFESSASFSRVLAVYILGHIFILQMFFYGVDGYLEYRIWAPYLLMSVFILANVSDTGFVKLFSLVSLFSIRLFLLTYLEFGKFGADYSRPLPGETRYEMSSIDAFRETVRPYIKYQKSRSAWCNTIDIPFRSYRANLVAIPPGVGFSILLWSDNLTLPLRARYVLMDDVDAERLVGKSNFISLTETSLGNLYFNEDSVCEKPTH